MANYTGLDKAEAGRLRAAVQKIEALLKRAGGITGDSASGTPLAELLHSAESKLASLELQEAEAVLEEKERAVREIEIAVNVRYEAALSVEENRQYQEFLSKEHFKKDDFDKLERFYSGPYDRLSEQGKSEMSYRVWEGVRREEYEFSELPGTVKQKEAERLHGKLNGSEKSEESLNRIPEKDKQDFVSAWEKGDASSAYKVLDRRVFAENVSVSHPPKTAEKALKQPLEKLDVRCATQGDSSPLRSTGSAACLMDLSLDGVTAGSTPAPGVLAAPLPEKGVAPSTRSK